MHQLVGEGEGEAHVLLGVLEREGGGVLALLRARVCVSGRERREGVERGGWGVLALLRARVHVKERKRAGGGGVEREGGGVLALLRVRVCQREWGELEEGREDKRAAHADWEGAAPGLCGQA